MSIEFLATGYDLVVDGVEKLTDFALKLSKLNIPIDSLLISPSDLKLKYKLISQNKSAKNFTQQKICEFQLQILLLFHRISNNTKYADQETLLELLQNVAMIMDTANPPSFTDGCSAFVEFLNNVILRFFYEQSPKMVTKVFRYFECDITAFDQTSKPKPSTQASELKVDKVIVKVASKIEGRKEEKKEIDSNIVLHEPQKKTLSRKNPSKVFKEIVIPKLGPLSCEKKSNDVDSFTLRHPKKKRPRMTVGRKETDKENVHGQANLYKAKPGMSMYQQQHALPNTTCRSSNNFVAVLRTPERKISALRKNSTRSSRVKGILVSASPPLITRSASTSLNQLSSIFTSPQKRTTKKLVIKQTPTKTK